MNVTKTLSFDAVRVGDCLPSLELPITIRSIVACAIATRDFHPVHHDVQATNALGSPTIFVSILTSNGYVERFVTEWAGPEALLKSVCIKLGVPSYAGDTIVLSGQISACDQVLRCVEILVKGTNSLGEHLAGKVVVALP